MKKLLGFTALLLVVIFPLGIAAMGNTTTAPAPSECLGKNVIAEIGGINISIPRNLGVSVTLKSLENFNLHLHDCEINKIQNVRNIRWTDLELIDPENVAIELQSEYKKWSDKIEGIKTEKKFLSENVEKIDLGNSELFVLPNAQTHNNEPVVFHCDKKNNKPPIMFESCQTSYFHPNGLFVIYKFSINDQPIYDHLKIDQEMRSRVNSLVQ